MLETARFHTSQTFTRGLSTLTRMDVGRIGSLATLPVLAAIRAQYGMASAFILRNKANDRNRPL